jgi:NTE family protein
MSESFGLVLTGGGARASYQVGALLALSEILPTEACPFQTICGTSAGAINAAYIASHCTDWKSSAQNLAQLWNQLELKQVYRTDGISLTQIAMSWISRTLLGGKGGTRKRANYLLNTEPLGKLIENEVDFQKIQEAIEKKHLHAVSISSVHYFTGTTVSFFSGRKECQPWSRSNRIGLKRPLNVNHILASAAIPIFFPPVEVENDYYGDGCLRQTTPLSPAVHLGATKILSIGIRHDRRKSDADKILQGSIRHSPSLAEIVGELMNSLFLDSLEADVERLQRINESMARLAKESQMKNLVGMRQIPILQLRPSKDLGEVVPELLHHFPPTLRYLLHGLGVSKNEGKDLLSYLSFFKDCIGPILELGYEDTLKRKDEIRAFVL